MENKMDKNLLASKKQFLNEKVQPTSTAPNIIVIVADDLGLNDVSCYNSKDFQTPNIDQLAKEGVKCTEGYVTSPICAPSRCGILTGRYQQRCGFETIDNDNYPSNIIEYLAGKKTAQKIVLGLLQVNHNIRMNGKLQNKEFHLLKLPWQNCLKNIIIKQQLLENGI
jgi:2,3-bisphosphoglycerate-independent phosphoglycerate mutase